MILDTKLDPEEKEILHDLLIAVASGLTVALIFRVFHWGAK